MAFNILKIIFFFTCAFIEWEIVSSQNFSGKSSYQLYDFVQHVNEFVEHIQASVLLQNIKNGLSEKEVLKYSNISDNDALNFFIWNEFNYASDNKCLQDIQYVIQNINFTKIDFNNLGNQWALKMIDSFGKPESGILDGNTKWLGDFNECRRIYAPKDELSGSGNFYGKYCNAQVSLSFLPVTLGICVPETCSPQDLLANSFLLTIVSKLSPIPNNFVPKLQSVSCKSNSRRLSSAGIATICLISLFSFLCLIGSCITVGKYILALKPFKNVQNELGLNGALNSSNQDVENHSHTDNSEITFIEGQHSKRSDILQNCEAFFNCFCIFTNGSKLLNTDSTEGQLLCLHGIRFLSMSWVILCHVYMGPVAMIRSMMDVLPEVDNLPFQVVLNGFYSVDSFFVLSGFLMSYLYFKEAHKKNNIPWTSWIYFYVHRYIRLTPVYMIVLAMSATLLVYFGSGPFWPDYDVDPVCRKNWWWNLLYISNFKDSADQCIGWTWYLSNDMQFFLISPLFLITLLRWPKIGYSVLGLFFCGTWIAGFVITYYYKLVPGGIGNVPIIAKDPTFIDKFNNYFNKVYTKPYTRIGPYLVGITLAYILFKRKQTNYKMSFLVQLIGWMLATIVGLSCVYGLYRNNSSLIATSLYNSVSRTCFAASLSWVIFACLSHQGGFVDAILSYKLFIPLSRLTYCAYLIHPLVITGYFSSLKDSLNFSHATMVFLFVGLIIITYAAALLVSLLFESPVIRLEKLMLKKSQK